MLQLFVRGIVFFMIAIGWVITMVHCAHTSRPASFWTVGLTLIMIIAVWEFGMHMALKYGKHRAE